MHCFVYYAGSTLCILCIAVPCVLLVNSYLIQDESIGTLHDLGTMSLWQIAVCVYLGIAAFISVSLDQMAYQRGNAAVITWLEYMSIPITFALNTFFLKDEPNTFEYIGVPLLLIGCILPEMEQIYTHYAMQRQEQMFGEIKDEECMVMMRCDDSSRNASRFSEYILSGAE